MELTAPNGECEAENANLTSVNLVHMKYMINSYFISSLDKLAFTFLDQSSLSTIQVKQEDLKYLQTNYLLTSSPLFKVGVKQTSHQ